jgi:hypothetical protein
MGKRRFRSMAEAEEAWQQADKAQGLLHMALNSVLAGKVRWLQRGQYRVGLCRAVAAHGGVVIVEYHAADQEPYGSAYYLDEWAGNVRGRLPSSDPEFVELHELAVKAVALRDELVREGLTCTR